MICLSDLPGNEKSSQPPQSLERALSGVVTGKRGRFSLFGKIADDYVSFAPTSSRLRSFGTPYGFVRFTLSFHDVVDPLAARETATAAAGSRSSEQALRPA
jgi:hypothetical protein